MKKFLLSLLTLGLTGSTALAGIIGPTNSLPNPGVKDAPSIMMRAPQAQADEDEEYNFDIMFATGLYTWSYFIQKNKVDYTCVIYVPANLATEIAGNKVTDIVLSCALILSNNLEGEIFVSENLEAEPVTSTSIKVVNAYASMTSGGYPYQFASFDDPYEIKADTGFYFGFTVKNCKYSTSRQPDYPVALDGMAPNGFAGRVIIKDNASGSPLADYDMATDAGTNLFLGAVTHGPSAGFPDMALLGNIFMDDFTLPVYNVDYETHLYVPIKNAGGNTLTSISYKLSNNGVESETLEAAIEVAPGYYGYLPIAGPSLVEGRNNIDIVITGINGKEFDVKGSATCLAYSGEGFDRMFVVEEGTGTWCGWCPRGIVGLDTMAKKYPETFVPIAVHSGDAMATKTYNSVISTYFNGFPSSIINRDPNFSVDPSAETLEEAYQAWVDQRSIAKVELSIDDMNYDKADKATNKVVATASVSFDINEENANYALAFVVLEDGIRGKQTNNYAGYPEELEWWGDQGSTVTWTYEHTARDIFSAFGLAESVPTTIVKGETYDFTYDVAMTSVTNIEKSTVIALLMDKQTGVILNASVVKADSYLSGVESVETDNANSPVEYFNLQGVRVANPVPGSLVIRRQGADVIKTVIR